MTPRVTTVVTKRKLLRNKVNPKALMRKVTMSMTTNKSFKKNLRNPVIIVKIGMCFASAVVKCPCCFWHDNYSICPVCGYEIPVDAEHVKESFARCYDCGALKHENMKTSKVSLYSPSERTFKFECSVRVNSIKLF